MKEILISCGGITEPLQLHQALAEAMDFPQWYGCNLDALYDCLTEIGEPVRVTFRDFDAMGQWREGFRETFADAAAENPHLTVRFREDALL